MELEQDERRDDTGKGLSERGKEVRGSYAGGSMPTGDGDVRAQSFPAVVRDRLFPILFQGCGGIAVSKNTSKRQDGINRSVRASLCRGRYCPTYTDHFIAILRRTCRQHVVVGTSRISESHIWTTMFGYTYVHGRLVAHRTPRGRVIHF